MPVLESVCSTCRAELNARGECLLCLLRGGLDEEDGERPRADFPRVFGDFEIDCHEDGSPWELGRGAMGVTYRARDHVLDRAVALKVVVIPGGQEKSPAVRERFLREARGAAGLHHPNVAEVFQFGTSPETAHAYYAMELIDGETLEERVRRDGPLPVPAALDIAVQVARALVAAAGRGLVHRDLKPGNIMLSRERATVIDFGLAKAMADAENAAHLTHGGFVGTPAFASPEQFRGGPADARSDIYSLGVTLWYALTGDTPFAGKTLEEWRDHPARAALPVAQLTARKVPARVVALLRAALAVDPAARPASARELSAALERCRQRKVGRVAAAAFAVVVLAVLGIGWRTGLWRARPATTMGQPAADQKAYALYARAKAIHVYEDPDGAERSMHEKVSLLEEATRRDPTFALAYCELAKAKAAFGPGKLLPEARKAAEQAARLGAPPQDYHLALAFIGLVAGDFDQARREATTVLDLSPNDAEALHLMSNTDTAQERWQEGLAEMEKAYELDPANYEIEWQLGQIYQAMRRYKARERLLADSRTASRVTIYWRDMASVGLKLDEGDPAGAREILRQVPPDYSPTAGIWLERFATALFLRDYDEAERVVAATPPQWQMGMYGGKPPQSWQNGLLAHLRGDEPKARAILGALRKRIAGSPGDGSDQDVVAFCDAVLGRKDDAIREARDLCGKFPLTELARQPGPVKGAILTLAKVYALTGERDRAIEQLEILAKLYETISYGDLRCSPYWGSLQGDPRFEKLVASLMEN